MERVGTGEGAEVEEVGAGGVEGDDDGVVIREALRPTERRNRRVCFLSRASV